MDAPDFAALFPVCRCGREDECETCFLWQLTPRTAAALWAVALLLADHADMDIADRGDSPVTGDGRGWCVFHDYPRFTWRQSAGWRRLAARSYPGIARDLVCGRHPARTCLADDMAIHLVLEYAEPSIVDEWNGAADVIDQLPEHVDDFQWEDARESLLLDTDLYYLFGPQHDGIEDPGGDVNQRMGIGDCRPEQWFTPSS